MNTEKIKKELVWIRQFIHKKDDDRAVEAKLKEKNT